MASAPQASLPLFYNDLMPLNSRDHGTWRAKSLTTAPWLKGQHAIPLTVEEFPQAQRFYPVIFSSGDNPVPLALMGLNEGVNVFVDDEGKIDTPVYIPAYVRRYPFVFATDDAQDRMVLCIDRAAEFIVEGGEMPFFEADNQPSDYTKRCMEFCNNFETERRRTVAFVQILKDLDLFETKTATFTPTNPDGTPAETQKIAEYFGVSEEKLNKLPPEKFIELRDNGALGQIYAHLMSLVGWDRLVALAMARAPAPPQAANA